MTAPRHSPPADEPLDPSFRHRLTRSGPFLALGLCLAAFIAAIVFKAWLCDDAFVTVRTADNWFRGFGPTWNPGERVQAYTHPLWLLLLSAAHLLTREFPYTALFLGLLLTLVTVWLFAFRAAPKAAVACLGVAVLATSRAFTDYATSGLENPLTHLLVVLFAGIYLGRGPVPPSPGILGVLLGLLLLNRIDAGLLVLPAAVALLVRPREGTSRLAWLPGLVPFALWGLFALFYYGTPFPNSAYAKLNAGVPAGELMVRGLYYLRNSLLLDPVTLVATLAGIVLPAVRRSARAAALGAGALLYVLYVIRIGGDFMSGRFLTAPLLLSCVALVQVFPRRAALPVAAALLLTMALPQYSPFGARTYAPRWDATIDDRGVADERAFFAPGSSLLHSRGLEPWPQPTTARDAAHLKQGENWKSYPFLEILHRSGVLSRAWPPAGRTSSAGVAYRPVVVWGGVGCMGYYLGPGVHVLDYHALGDPLLARLPAAIPDPVMSQSMPRLRPAKWRVGHFCREIPAGYPETLSTGVNQLADPDLARYYDRLRLVTRGPLLDRSRLRAIWELHTGRYAPWVEAYRQRELRTRSR